MTNAWEDLDRELGKFRHYSVKDVIHPKFGVIHRPMQMDMEIPTDEHKLPIQALIDLHLYDKNDKSYKLVKTAVDSGSSALVLPTDKCRECTGDYGKWDGEAPGKESGGDQDFQYGGGDYEATYWKTLCTFDDGNTANIEFAGVDKVKSGNKQLSGIGGMMPRETEKPGFVSQLYHHLDKSLPRSFVFDMYNKKLIVGARAKGTEIQCLGSEDIGLPQVPYYIVGLESLEISVDGGAYTSVKVPNKVIIDTGTTFFASESKISSAIKGIAKNVKHNIHMVVTLKGGIKLDVNLPANSRHISDGLFDMDMLGDLDMILIGILFMNNRVITFDSDRNSLHIA